VQGFRDAGRDGTKINKSMNDVYHESPPLISVAHALLVVCVCVCVDAWWVMGVCGATIDSSMDGHAWHASMQS